MQPVPLQIRPAEPRDAEGLAKVHVESWRAGYAAIVPPSFLSKVNLESRRAHFQIAIDSGKEEPALCEQDGVITGFVTLGRSRDGDAAPGWGEIWGIYVAPAHWRRGVGSALLAWALDLLARRGCRVVTLWVLADNRQARAFYEARGFCADGASKLIDLDFPLRALRYSLGARRPCTSKLLT